MVLGLRIVVSTQRGVLVVTNSDISHIGTCRASEKSNARVAFFVGDDFSLLSFCVLRQ